MKADRKKQREITGSENRLLKELGKGIDSMENGRTVPHDKAMQMIWKKLKTQANYDI